VFQSRWAEADATESADMEEEVAVVEAYRITCDAGLKDTPRFAEGTRRFGAAELSFIRRGDGELAVVYVQGASNNGCNRQLIAVVRRDGAAPSMLNSKDLSY
jgi:hypothetical protein